MHILDKQNDLIQYNFPISQYIAEDHPKSQIFLHHTAGNADAAGTFRYWESNVERIATCVAIAGKPKKTDAFINGQIVQGYPSKYWAYHLGLKESTFYKFHLPYKSLDKISVAVEICNWGQLTYKNGKYYTYVNTLVDKKEVCELATSHRGFKYYHNYTDAQIISLEKLLRYWGSKYNIPLTYNDDIFDICPRALRGDAGIYTHNSVRYGKVDIYPHPKLIEMLKAL